jgi:hypothetical protein
MGYLVLYNAVRYFHSPEASGEIKNKKIEGKMNAFNGSI